MDVRTSTTGNGRGGFVVSGANLAQGGQRVRRWCRDLARRGFPDDLAEVADRDEVVEWLGELDAADGFVVDPDALEDRLIEQAPGSRLRQHVGRLKSVGQFQRDVKSGEHLAVVDRQFGLEPLGAGAFAPEAVLLVVEEGFGDAVGVMGGEQLAFLAVQSADEFGEAGTLRSSLLVELGHVCAHVAAHGLASPADELDVSVVVLDRLLDSADPPVRLRAAAVLAAAADEVLIRSAVPLGAGIDQASAALAAVDAASQVVVVAPVALAALALRLKYVLDGLEGRQVDQARVPALVDLVGVPQDTDVVVVAEQLGEPVGVERSTGCAPGWLAAQAACFEHGRQFGQRVVAGRVQTEGRGHERAAVGVDRDGADLTAVEDLAHVDVADWRSKRRAAALGLLGRALHDFQAKVLGVELGDRAHDAVQQQAGRCLVDVLADRYQRGAGLPDSHDDRDIVGAVARQPIELVHNDVANISLCQAGQHALQGRPLGRRARFAAFDELLLDDRIEARHLSHAA